MTVSRTYKKSYQSIREKNRKWEKGITILYKKKYMLESETTTGFMEIICKGVNHVDWRWVYPMTGKCLAMCVCVCVCVCVWWSKCLHVCTRDPHKRDLKSQFRIVTALKIPNAQSLVVDKSIVVHVQYIL